MAEVLDGEGEVVELPVSGDGPVIDYQGPSCGVSMPVPGATGGMENPALAAAASMFVLYPPASAGGTSDATV